MLFRNTSWQAAALLTSYVFGFLLAPLMLARLGLEAFGVWAVTGALAMYGGFLDFGIRRSLSRFVALYDARGDRAGIREAIGLGLLSVAAVGTLALGAAWLAAPVAVDLLGVLTVAEMRIVLLASVALVVTAAVREVIASVGIGLRRMKPPNLAVVCVNVTNFAASVAVLLLSTELTHYAVANAAAGVVSIAYQIVAVRFVWSGRLAAFPSRSRVREILGYSVKNQLVTLSDLVNLQTDKILIAGIAGPAAAGAYEVANRAVIAIRALGWLTASAVVPTATAAIVERGRSVIGRYYRHYTRRCASISVPVFGGAVLSAPYLLVVWLGEAPGQAELILIVLCAAQFGSVVSVIAQTLANSDGRPGLPAGASVAAAALNVCLTLALAPLLGLWGVLLATVLALTVGSVALLQGFHRAYGLAWRDFGTAVGPPVLVTLALMVPYVAWYALAGAAPASRVEALPGLAATLGLFGGAYWLIASRMRLLPEPLRVQSLVGRAAGALARTPASAGGAR